MKTFILIALFFTQSIHANNDRMETQRQEVAAFFDQYLKNFNDYINNPQNQQAITQATSDVHIPALMFPGNGQLSLVEDSALVGTGTQAFLDRLITQQVTRLKWQQVQIKVLNDHTAVANNRVVLLAADNQVQQTMSSTYVLYKSAGTWQIVLRAFQPA